MATLRDDEYESIKPVTGMAAMLRTFLMEVAFSETRMVRQTFNIRARTKLIGGGGTGELISSK